MAAVGFLILMPQPVVAQEPRTRTLVYDAGRGEWIEQPPPLAGTPAGELHAVRVQIKEDKYRAALSAIKKFVEEYGNADPLYPEILITEAQALIGRRDYYKAHVVLQTFLSQFGGMSLTSEALRLEFVIADTFLTGVKRKVWGMRILSGTDIAYDILDQIAVDYSDSRLAQLALKTKADHLFKSGDHALAKLEYARLLRDYPRSRYHQFSLRRSADAVLASFSGVDYDETSLGEAAERYREYRLRYPSEADREGVGLILAGISEARAEKDLSVGAFYERTGHLGSAIFSYRLVRQNWPKTIAAVKAKQRLELLGAAKPVVRPGTAQSGTGSADQRGERTDR